MNRKPYIPLGCDQQGRYPDSADDVPPPDDKISAAIVRDVVLSLVVLCALWGVIVAAVMWVAS